MPVPASAGPPDTDRNGNGTICVKMTSSGNVIVHDDPPGQTTNDFVDDMLP
jgi:hypothetical protein